MNICLGTPIPTKTPEIYVVCSASEKRDNPYGICINALQPFKAIVKQIEAMLDASPALEAKTFTIKDSRGFSSFTINKNEDISQVHLKALLVSSYGELGPKLMAYYKDDLEEAINAIHSRYVGVYDSELEYAMALFETHYLLDVPTKIQPYIDYVQFQRDIFKHDYFSIRVEGSRYIFVRH